MGRKKLDFSKLLEPEEQNKLLKAPNTELESGFRDYCIIYFMLNSGLRISEVVSLKPEHIDWTRRYITVIGGKGDKDRVVPIDTPVLNVLKEWSKKRPKFGETFFCVLRGSDRGKAMTVRNLRKLIDRYAKKAAIKHTHPHMLRHCYATNLIERGVPLEIVQQLLGHEDIKTTTIYAQFRPTHLAKYFN